MNDDAFWAGWNTAEHEDYTGVRRTHHLEDTEDFRRGYEAYDAYGAQVFADHSAYGMHHQIEHAKEQAA